MNARNEIFAEMDRLLAEVEQIESDHEAKGMAALLPSPETHNNKLVEAFLLPVYRNLGAILTSSECLSMRKSESKWEIGYWRDGLKRTR